MTFEIEAAGRTYTVDVRRSAEAGRFDLRIDGVLHIVDARPTGDRTWSIVDPATGRSHEAAVHLAPAGEGVVAVGSVLVPLTINGRRSRRRGDAAPGHGEQRVVAPMPGRVLRLLVGPGDTVEARQPLVIVEAMKMENALSVPRPGRVREIAVAEGTSVEAGRLLLVVGDSAEG